MNQASTVEVYCGDPDWEAAFALSQKQALSLFIQGMDWSDGNVLILPPGSLTKPAPRLFQKIQDFGNGSNPTWNAFTWGMYWQVAPEMAVGLVRSQLGNVGDEGQPIQNGMLKNNMLPLPLLAGMAWEACQRLPGRNFLAELFPALEKILECWLDQTHDRDGDGLPECDFHPAESLDDPTLQVGQRKLQACLDSYFVENPSLGAMLYHDFQALAGMAGELGMVEHQRELQQKAEHLREAVEECWDNHAGIYHRRDWLSHQSPAGSDLGNLKGSGTLECGQHPFHTPPAW